MKKSDYLKTQQHYGSLTQHRNEVDWRIKNQFKWESDIYFPVIFLGAIHLIISPVNDTNVSNDSLIF